MEIFGDEIGKNLLYALKELESGINNLTSSGDKDGKDESNEIDIINIITGLVSLSNESNQNLEYGDNWDGEDQSIDMQNDNYISDDRDDMIHSNKEYLNSDCSHDDNNPQYTEYESNCNDQISQNDNEYDEKLLETGKQFDMDEDEWDDDNDLGYVLVPVSEKQFFDIEEETIYNNSLGRNGEKEDCEEPGFEYDDSENGDLWNDLEAVERLRGKNSDREYTEDELIPPPPEDDGEEEQYEEGDTSLRVGGGVGAGVDVQEEEEGNEEGNVIDDDPLLSRERNLTYIGNYDENHHEKRSSRMGGRRSSEIMGQNKFRGADGEHCFFNLKVIFDPYKTGFEEDKNFAPPSGTIVAGRYQVEEVLGTAAFSTALQCIDLEASSEADQWVCLKVIKNSKDFFDQSLDEIKLLQYINSKGDANKNNVLRMIDYFYFKEHLFIVSELLRENLYEFGKYLRENGGKPYFTFPRLKKIMKQILEALVYIHSLNLIHCDIKPENIVIKSYSRCEVKLIDFGSSCFATDHLTSYIQSRSYRAPEVILGLPYNAVIDIWSLGGVLAEMFTGYVLFQNDSIATMLARIAGILGPYPPYMIREGREAAKYFTLSNVVFERVEEGEGFVYIYPKRTNLRSRLHIYSPPNTGEELTQDDLFVDFVTLMLQVDPLKRPTAAHALLHPWLNDVDSLDVTYTDN